MRERIRKREKEVIGGDGHVQIISVQMGFGMFEVLFAVDYRMCSINLLNQQNLIIQCLTCGARELL